jgi:hypothetical protein
MTIAFITLLPQLIAAGLATATEVGQLVKSFHPTLTDAERAAILNFIVADADKQIAIALKDKGPQVGPT